MRQDFIRDNQMIIQALRQAQNEKTDDLIKTAKENTYVASERFERKMQRLVAAQRRPYYKYTNTRAKRAVLVLAAAIVLMITMVFSVSALREPVVRFFVETFELFSTVWFESPSSEELPPEELSQIFVPSYIPEGFVLDEDLTMSFQAIFVYLRENEMIIYQQFLHGGPGIDINTEGVIHEYILVGEHNGLFYSNLGVQTILWSDDRHYGFSVSGPVPREALLTMALSLTEK